MPARVERRRSRRRAGPAPRRRRPRARPGRRAAPPPGARPPRPAGPGARPRSPRVAITQVTRAPGRGRRGHQPAGQVGLVVGVRPHGEQVAEALHGPAVDHCGSVHGRIVVPSRSRGADSRSAYPPAHMGSTARWCRGQRVSVLGPVRLLLDGRDRTPGGALQRRLLCALALRAAVAATDRGPRRPAVARGPAGRPPGRPPDPRVPPAPAAARGRDRHHAAAGYRLDLRGRGARRRPLRGRSCTTPRRCGPRDPEAAAARLDEALGWWRGTPYDELAEVDDARIEAARLAELRRPRPGGALRLPARPGPSPRGAGRPGGAGRARAAARAAPGACSWWPCTAAGAGPTRWRCTTASAGPWPTELGIDPSAALAGPARRHRHRPRGAGRDGAARPDRRPRDRRGAPVHEGLCSFWGGTARRRGRRPAGATSGW